MQARVIVDGPAAGELEAALRLVLDRFCIEGWLLSVVHLGHPWWCLNVLVAHQEPMLAWSHVGTRAELPAALAQILSRAGLTEPHRPRGRVVRLRRRPPARHPLELAS